MQQRNTNFNFTKQRFLLKILEDYYDKFYDGIRMIYMNFFNNEVILFFCMIGPILY